MKLDPTGAVSNKNVMRAINESFGKCWFSNESMRFFKSRIYEAMRVKLGYVFVSGEIHGDEDDERFSVRVMFENTGDVDNIGDYREYSTHEDALNDALAISEWLNK